MGMKGIVFTTDMIIGLSLAIVLLFLIPLNIETSHTETSFQELLYQSNDLVNLLSIVKASSFSNTPTISGLLSNNVITTEDLNNTILDLIGSFWYSGNESIASNITKDILENLTTKCFSLKTQNGIIYSSCNYTSSDALGVSQRIASGYELGKPVSGYVSRAFLTSIKSKTTSSYAYFGGYVGEGNITENITLSNFSTIVEAYMELDAGNNFTLYINGNYAGFYLNGSAGGGHMRSDKWVVCNMTYNNNYCNDFISGGNTLSFNFTGNNSFIGGGYFKVTYNTTQMTPEEEVGKDTYWFPGIKGFFNLYDSFYVPGTLTDMTSYLHYYNNISNATIYLAIGNIKVFRNNAIGEQKFSLSYSDIWQKFGNQQNLINNVSNRTVPLRLGVEEFEAQGGGVGATDAVLVTDVSGSMDTCDVNSNLFSDCSGTPGMQNRRIDVAKNVSKVFVDTLLNTSGDRVGLVAYSAEPGIRWWYGLSNNSASLKSQINSYTSNGYTCISCGVSNATNTLLAQSSPNRFRGILVMSDGQANTIIPGTDGGGGGSTSQCPDTEGYRSNAGREATQKSCDARNSGINATFGVAFGVEADQEQMKRISCWNCTACPNVCLTDEDCIPLSQSNCQAMNCNWNSTAPSNVTIFSDGFERDIATNWTVSSNWARATDEDHSGSYSAKKSANSASGNLTSKSTNTSGSIGVYVSFWYRDDDTDANEVTLEFNDSSGHWDSIADLSSSTEDRWNNYATKITDSQYFHSGFAVRFRGSTLGNGENFWIDDVKIIKTVIGGCEKISSSCWIGNVTLPNGTQADCRAVRYAQSNDVDELKNIYGTFGEMLVKLAYTTQIAAITGNLNFSNVLYPDSYIELNYTPAIIPYEYGEISLTRETERFKNFTGDTIDIPYKEGWLNVSEKVKVTDARVTSYSSEFWTDRMYVKNASSGWKTAYWLGDYGNYTPLGDPFIVQIPVSYLGVGNNSVRIGTGLSPDNATGGSPDDRIIYTIRLKGSVGYENVFSSSQLATDDAKQRLIQKVSDYVDVNLDDIQIDTQSVSGIKWLWGPSMFKVLLWERE